MNEQKKRHEIRMSLAAIALRNQRKLKRQPTKSSDISSAVINIDQNEQGQQQQHQQQLMLHAMKLASQEDHRYYSSGDKAVVQFPPAAAKAIAAHNHAHQRQSLSHISIRSGYAGFGEASLNLEEVL